MRKNFILFIPLLLTSVLLTCCDHGRGNNETNIFADTSLTDMNSPRVDTLQFTNDAKTECKHLLKEVNISNLRDIAGEHSTSTIASKEDIPSSMKSKGGTFGRYTLLHKIENNDDQLGTLIVHTNSNPDKWQQFEAGEQILSINLIDTGYEITPYLYVGQQLEEVSKHINPLLKISTDQYVYEDSCEQLNLLISHEGRIRELILKVK